MRYKQMTVTLGLLTFVSLGILRSDVSAQELKKVYTLQESIAEAFAKNYAYRAKQERVDQATQVKNQRRTEFFPKLSTSYVYSRMKDDSRNFGQLVVPASKDNYEWRTTLTQPVFRGFELISSYELAKLGIDQSEMEVELEKLDLALRVKEAYFNILIADKAVDVAEKDVAARKSSADVARSFYKVGMIPINELLQAEVELANTQQALARAQNAARVARSAFNTVLSRPVNAPVDVVEPDPLWEPVRGELQEYMARALENRPEIKVINIGLMQSDQEIRLANSKYYPEVSLTAEYVKEGDTPDVSGSDFHDARDLRAMANLTWTFWEWGKTRYSVREKESFKRELMKEKLGLEEDISFEVKQAVLDLETAEKNIPTTRKAVEQGEENLRVSEERYKAQVTTITEVLDAQTRLTQARVNYFSALYDHHLAKARLFKAMGEY